VIRRYTDAMGGRGSLERLLSVRLSGSIRYPSGIRHKITVLKKKPDLARVVLDTGTVRFVQAYNGKFAWFSREAGKNVTYDRMRGQMAEEFIREAPLESVLVSSTKAVHRLGPDVKVAMIMCYQVISEFPDGSKIVHYIDKEEFLERRILQYDSAGVLLSELIPGKFESVDGVVFSMQIVRMQDGQVVSTLALDEVQTNVGILDSAFYPPEGLDRD
jgi:outer membrane lipoprotein-sorting protein